MKINNIWTNYIVDKKQVFIPNIPKSVNSIAVDFGSTAWGYKDFVCEKDGGHNSWHSKSGESLVGEVCVPLSTFDGIGTNNAYLRRVDDSDNWLIITVTDR